MTWERERIPTNELKKKYVRLYPERRRLTNKLSWLKRNYGEEAVVYFLDRPFCESCGEDRFSCLAIHHTEGKNSKVFRVLCMNCHAVEHSGPGRLADCAGMKVRGRQI